MSFTNPKTMDNVSDDGRRKIVRSNKKCPMGKKVCDCPKRSRSVPIKIKKYLSTKNASKGKELHQHTYKEGNKFSSSNIGHRHPISSNGRILLAVKTGHRHTLVKKLI